MIIIAMHCHIFFDESTSMNSRDVWWLNSDDDSFSRAMWRLLLCAVRSAPVKLGHTCRYKREKLFIFQSLYICKIGGLLWHTGGIKNERGSLHYDETLLLVLWASICWDHVREGLDALIISSHGFIFNSAMFISTATKYIYIYLHKVAF